jgi:hypothetical protein
MSEPLYRKCPGCVGRGTVERRYAVKVPCPKCKGRKFVEAVVSEYLTWGILELMGHVRMAGQISEEERFGSKVGRIDCPSSESPDGTGFVTVYFTAASVYRLTACTEEAARAVAYRSVPRPVHQYELPAPTPAGKRRLYDDDDDDRNLDDREC